MKSLTWKPLQWLHRDGMPARFGSARRGLPLLILPVLFFPLLFTPPGLFGSEHISIYRPLKADRSVLGWDDDMLLRGSGGRVMLFEVEVSAFSRVVEIRINGEWQDFEKSTWALVKKPIPIKPGWNEVGVFARTKEGTAYETFRIMLTPPPAPHPPPPSEAAKGATAP